LCRYAGFVNHFNFLLTEVTNICLDINNFTGDFKAVNIMLLSLLDTLHKTLKYVSDVVRRALEVSQDIGIIISYILQRFSIRCIDT